MSQEQQPGLTDEQVVAIVLRGQDDPQFREAWDLLAGQVRRAAGHAGRGLTGADREAFIKDVESHVWQKLGMCDANRWPLRAWLRIVARNLAYDLLRKRRREPVGADAEPDQRQGREPSPRARIEAAESWRRMPSELRSALDDLAPQLDARRGKVDYHAIFLLMVREQLARSLGSEVPEPWQEAAWLVPWHDRELVRRPTPQLPTLACIWGSCVLGWKDGPSDDGLDVHVFGAANEELLRQWRKRCLDRVSGMIDADGPLGGLLKRD